MNGIAGFLVLVWLFSLPFSQFSVVGTLSVDNILGPLLIVLWLFVKRRNDLCSYNIRLKHNTIVFILIFIYFLAHMASLLMTQVMAWRTSYILISDLTYFVVPILYLSDEKLRRRSVDVIVIITMIGCISAFLASLGILHLEGARFSPGRLGVTWLPKTVGLFSTYGDMALLMSYTLLVAFSKTTKQLLFGKKNFVKILLVCVVVILGFMGSQSRNIFLTVVIAIALLLYLVWLQKLTSRWKKFYFMSIAAGFLIAIMGLFFYGQYISDSLSGMGGTNSSEATAEARLSQYNFAWQILKNNSLFGASEKILLKYELEITFIHNMWLKELVQGGVIALLAIFGLIVIGMKNIARCIEYNPQIPYLRASLVLLVVMFVSTQFNPSGTSIFWMLLGMCVVSVSSRKRLDVTSVSTFNRTNRIS